MFAKEAVYDALLYAPSRHRRLPTVIPDYECSLAPCLRTKVKADKRPALATPQIRDYVADTAAGLIDDIGDQDAASIATGEEMFLFH